MGYGIARRDGRLRALQRGIEKPLKMYQLRPDLTVTADRAQSYLTVGFERRANVEDFMNVGNCYGFASNVSHSLLVNIK